MQRWGHDIQTGMSNKPSWYRQQSLRASGRQSYLPKEQKEQIVHRGGACQLVESVCNTFRISSDTNGHTRDNTG